ncbi:MAG: type II toxin-antitoxin system RelE/ParE family toxin [Gemmatimonadetes bacterium]|nr:type II toxin-antitoxin system RelE/ParE family toxin [Gemmatimonadota bacterium]
MEYPPLRPLVWLGASRKEFRRFPEDVTRLMGYRLFLVQANREVPGEKPLSGGVLKGLGIREIRDDHDRDTYRVVYTVRLTNAVYVLHAFKKKSKFGISTPVHEIEVVRRRYLRALESDAAWQSSAIQDEIDE